MGLPGDRRKVPAGDFCETEGHETIPATWRVQGETDSFGAEYIYLCDECVKDLGRHWYEGTCPKCGTQDVKLYAYRDPDEGSNGPVYQACCTCRSKILASFIDDELAEYYEE